MAEGCVAHNGMFIKSYDSERNFVENIYARLSWAKIESMTTANILIKIVILFYMLFYYACYSTTHWEVRGQLAGAGCLLHPAGSQGL